MQKIEWNKKFETGIDRIDVQHQNLVGYVNSLIEENATPESHSEDVLRYILEQVLEYTVFHFKVEEEMMRNAGYPHYDQHIKEHEVLKTNATNLYNRILKGEKGLGPVAVSFLQKWLLTHIAASDMDYVPYVMKHQEAELKKSNVA